MAAWESRVDQLLYEGEEVRRQVGGESVGVVVTSHRVLAFTPETEGPNFRAVDRPNVTDVGRRTAGETRWLVNGVKWLVIGVFLLAGGALFDFEGLLGDVDVSQGTGRIGLGGILGLFSLMRTVFALMDDAFLLGGAIAAAGGLVALGWYLQTRRTDITIAVAGEEDIHLPKAGLTDDDIEAIAAAVEPP